MSEASAKKKVSGLNSGGGGDAEEAAAASTRSVAWPLRSHSRVSSWLRAHLDSFNSGFVYCIDIDTNGEVDCSFTQLPLTVLAWAAAELEP